MAPMRPKGKRIAIAVTALGIATLAMAGLMLWKPILERWYLQKLEVGTPGEQENAIKRLGVVGSKSSMIKLQELWGLAQVRLLMKQPLWPNRGQLKPSDGFGEPPNFDSLLKSIDQIEHRVGMEKAIASNLKIITDETEDPQRRICLSMCIIDKLENLPAVASTGRIDADPGIDVSSYVNARIVAIRVVSTFQYADDARYRDAVTSIFLKLWGTPSPSKNVWEEVDKRLKRMQGN